MRGPLHSDDRGRISYPDVVMTFAVLVMIVVIAPLVYNVFGMIEGTADPLTTALFALVVPMLLIGLMLSMGVAGRS